MPWPAKSRRTAARRAACVSGVAWVLERLRAVWTVCGPVVCMRSGVAAAGLECGKRPLPLSLPSSLPLPDSIGLFVSDCTYVLVTACSLSASLYMICVLGCVYIACGCSHSLLVSESIWRRVWRPNGSKGAIARAVGPCLRASAGRFGYLPRHVVVPRSTRSRDEDLLLPNRNRSTDGNVAIRLTDIPTTRTHDHLMRCRDGCAHQSYV